jgi:hypothetical protein
VISAATDHQKKASPQPKSAAPPKIRAELPENWAELEKQARAMLDELQQQFGTLKTKVHDLREYL